FRTVQVEGERPGRGRVVEERKAREGGRRLVAWHKNRPRRHEVAILRLQRLGRPKATKELRRDQRIGLNDQALVAAVAVRGHGTGQWIAREHVQQRARGGTRNLHGGGARVDGLEDGADAQGRSQHVGAQALLRGRDDERLHGFTGPSWDRGAWRANSATVASVARRCHRSATRNTRFIGTSRIHMYTSGRPAMAHMASKYEWGAREMDAQSRMGPRL